MSEERYSPEYLRASIDDVRSLVDKLTEFGQALGSVEQSLLMERIRRCMPAPDIEGSAPLAATHAVFAAWINSIVPGESRWFPS